MGFGVHSTSDGPAEVPLQDDLARCCLPESKHDPDIILAWVNSICLLFLLVGVLGAKRGSISFRAPPTIDKIIPVILEPVSQPPSTESELKQEMPDEQDKQETPNVVVVIPDTPAINFAVPTLGNLVAPSALAQPPPLNPLEPPAPLNRLPSTLNDTGTSGKRPRPPYPRIALEQAQQGSVTLLISADEKGKIISIEVKKSSGYPALDRSTVDFVRRHWTVPVGAGSHLFETTIIYRLQAS